LDSRWADLLNSDYHDYRGSGIREDWIWKDEWLRKFLARCGWTSDRLPGNDEREALRQLRELLRRVVDKVRTGRNPAPADTRALNRVLEAAPLVRRLELGADRAELVLAPHAEGIERVMGEVVASFGAMLSEGEATRIKVCANPDCGWVIYDSSRNRTRRWCDKTECGNLIKVRRHRRRQREQAS